MATFYNQATLTYNGMAVASNVTTGEIVEVLSAVKTASIGTYRAGDTITYVVSLVNSGTTPLTGLTLTDDLGVYTDGTTSRVPLSYIEGSVLYYQNGVLQGAPSVTVGTALFISGITVPAGGNAVIIYQVDVNAFAPLGTGGEITNTVSVSGGGLMTPVVAEETVTVRDEAILSITKSLSPTTVAENGEITYTFVIQNTGNTEAGVDDNVSVSDTFDPILENITVTFNGTAWSSPANYTYDEATGVFTTVPGQITVPAASYTRDPDTGAISITPGVSVLTVTGTI